MQHIVETWRELDGYGAYKDEWGYDFSRDIVPKECYSHYDYWCRVPLYDALAIGCVSFEADTWLTDDNELFVSHSWRSTTQHRTLHSLYLDPLANIFEKRNVTAASSEIKKVGILDADPTASNILLIDFKSDRYKTWLILMQRLQLLRDKRLAQIFRRLCSAPRPPHCCRDRQYAVRARAISFTSRFVFFNAPLLSVADERYSTINSYYAANKSCGYEGVEAQILG